MKKLMLVIAFLVLGISIYVTANKQEVKANPNHWEDTSSCTPISCGTTEGTKTQVCIAGGHGSNCKPEKWECPQGSTEFDGKCWRWVQTGRFSWQGHYESVDKVKTRDADTQTVSCKIPEEQVIACEDTRTKVCGDILSENYTTNPTEDEVVDNSVCKYPVPAPRPSEPNYTPTAFMCPNGDVVSVPLNPHVIRSGSDAIVQWFWTGGDSANIYFKEVSEANWTNALRDVARNGDFASVTIHDLNPSLGYTFGIQQKVSCGGGTVVSVIVDGPKSNTFGFSFLEWMK